MIFEFMLWVFKNSVEGLEVIPQMFVSDEQYAVLSKAVATYGLGLLGIAQLGISRTARHLAVATLGVYFALVFLWAALKVLKAVRSWLP